MSQAHQAHHAVQVLAGKYLSPLDLLGQGAAEVSA